MRYEKPPAAEALRRYLDEKKIPAAQCARWLSVTRQAVYLWLAGRTAPRRKTAAMLDELTGGSVPKGDW